MLKLGLAWVLCPGTATACTALSQGIVPLSHFGGEKHTGKRQTQRRKGAFFQPQHFQGAPVPLRAPHVMGTVGWSRLPPEEAILSKELPDICALSLVEITFREGFTQLPCSPRPRSSPACL